jgi:hypothetical protein
MLEFRLQTTKDRTYDVKPRCERVVLNALIKAGFDIEAQTKQNIADQDSIDTGAYMNSVYVVTPRSSTYARASSKAKSAANTPGRHSGRPNSDFKMLPEEPGDIMTVVVAIGAEYGANVEFGNAHVAPRPAFIPAVDDVTAVLDSVIEDYINKVID